MVKSKFLGFVEAPVGVSYDNATSWRAVIHAAPLVQGPKYISLGQAR